MKTQRDEKNFAGAEEKRRENNKIPSKFSICVREAAAFMFPPDLHWNEKFTSF